MSKLDCKCGAVIYDRTGDVPWKGWLYSDIKFFDLIEAIRKDAEALFSSDQHPHKDNEAPTSTEDSLHFLITKHLIHNARNVYQCTSCGRVHIAEKERPNHFVSFVPERSPHTSVF